MRGGRELAALVISVSVMSCSSPPRDTPALGDVSGCYVSTVGAPNFYYDGGTVTIRGARGKFRSTPRLSNIGYVLDVDALILSETNDGKAEFMYRPDRGYVWRFKSIDAPVALTLISDQGGVFTFTRAKTRDVETCIAVPELIKQIDLDRAPQS